MSGLMEMRIESAELDDDDDLVKMFRNILNTYDHEPDSELKQLLFYYKVCSVCRAWRVACEKVLASMPHHGDARYDREELKEEEDEEVEEEDEEESSDYDSDEEED